MYKRNCGKCRKQQIYGENKQTLLARKSSQNKAQQAETYVSGQGLVLHTDVAFLSGSPGNGHRDIKQPPAAAGVKTE